MVQDRLVHQFLENRDGILAFIFALTRDFDAAEDIFQNVAMVVVEEEHLTTNVGNFRAWVREIARRRVAEYFTKKSKRDSVEQPSETLQEMISQSFAEHDRETDRQHRLQALMDCVKKLPSRSRQMIEEFYGRRCSVRQLAALMKWKVNSVKVALSRARVALADCVSSRLAHDEAR